MIDSKTAVGVKIKRAFLIINLQNIITGLIRVGFTNDEIPNNKPGHVNLGKVEHIKEKYKSEPSLKNKQVIKYNI